MGQPNVNRLSLSITVAKLGEGFLAITDVGNVRVAGGRRNTAYEATTSLFAVLAGQSGDNSAAAVAVELLIAGVTMEELTALSDGKDVS